MNKTRFHLPSWYYSFCFLVCFKSISLKLIISLYRHGVGVTGSHQTLYYAEVTDAMKVSEGGGNISEGEFIDVVEMDLTKAYALMYDETAARPGSLILALMWFFQHKMPPKVNQKL